MSANKVKVLIVEPDVAGREILQLRLSGGGYPALGVRDAGFARTVLQEMRPDVMVVDAAVLEPEGPSFLEEVNAPARANPVPIVVTGAKFSKPFLARLIALGAKDCLLKPFGAAE